MSGKGGDGDAKRPGDCPEDGVYLTKGCPCRRGIGAEVVDRGLDNNIGNAVRTGLEASRQSDPEFCPEKIRVNPDHSQPQLQQIIRFHQRTSDQDCADCLRNNGGNGRTCNAHPKDDNSKKIQHDI